MSRYKKLKPIGEYIIDKEEMIEQVFASIPIIEMRNMVPIKLQGMPLHELKAECMVELLAMSDREILNVLEGRKIRDAESSESGSEAVFVISDEERRIKNEKKDLKTSKVVIDDRSSTERSSSSRKKKKKRVKKEVDDKIEPKSKKRKRRKDKEEDLPSSSNDPKTSTATNSGKKKTVPAESKPKKSIDDDVMILEEISSDEGEVVKEKVQEKSLLDLLELEMRARAIRSLLKKEDDVRAQKILSEYQDEPDDLIPVIEEHPKIEILSDSDDNEVKVDPSSICIEMHLDGNNLCSKDADVLDSLLGISAKSLANTTANTASRSDISPIVVDDESTTACENINSGESAPAVPSGCQPSQSDCAPGVLAETMPTQVERNAPKTDIYIQKETAVESIAIKEEPLDNNESQNLSLPHENANRVPIKAEAPSDIPGTEHAGLEKNQELGIIQDQGATKINSSANSKSDVVNVSVPKPIQFSIKREPCSPERNEKPDSSLETESKDDEREELGQCKVSNAGTEDTTISESGTHHDFSENSMARESFTSSSLKCDDFSSVVSEEFSEQTETVSIDASLAVETTNKDKSESVKTQETVSSSGSCPASEAKEFISNDEDFPDKPPNSQNEETNPSESPENDEVDFEAKQLEISSSFLRVDSSLPNDVHFLEEQMTEKPVELGCLAEKSDKAPSPSDAPDEPVLQENAEVNQSKNDHHFLGVSDGSPVRTEKIYGNEIFLGEPSAFGHKELTHRKSVRNEESDILADVDPPDGPPDPPSDERNTAVDLPKSGNHFLGVTEGSVETDVCDAKLHTTLCQVVEIPSFAEPSVSKINTLPTTCYDPCPADGLAICSEFDDDALDYDDDCISLVPDDQASFITGPVGSQNGSGENSLLTSGERDDGEIHRQSYHKKKMNPLICESTCAVVPVVSATCSSDLEATSTDGDAAEELITSRADDEILQTGSDNDSNNSRPACGTQCSQEGTNCDRYVSEGLSNSFRSFDPSSHPTLVSENHPLPECSVENSGEHSGIISRGDEQSKHVKSKEKKISDEHDIYMNNCIDLISEDGDDIDGDLDESLCESPGESLIIQPKKIIDDSASIIQTHLGQNQPKSSSHQTTEQCFSFIEVSNHKESAGEPYLGDYIGGNNEALPHSGTSSDRREHEAESAENQKELSFGCIDLVSDDEELSHTNKFPSDCAEEAAETTIKSQEEERRCMLEEQSKNVRSGLAVSIPSNLPDLVSLDQQILEVETPYGCIFLMSDEDEESNSNLSKMRHPDGDITQINMDQQFSHSYGTNDTSRLPELEPSVTKTINKDVLRTRNESNDCVDLMSDDEEESHPNVCQVEHPNDKLIDETKSQPGQQFPAQFGIEDTTPSLPKQAKRNTATTDASMVTTESNNCINLMSDDEGESLLNVTQLDCVPVEPRSSVELEFPSQLAIDTSSKLPELVDGKTSIKDIPITRNESSCINLMSDEEESHPNVSQLKHPHKLTNIGQTDNPSTATQTIVVRLSQFSPQNEIKGLCISEVKGENSLTTNRLKVSSVSNNCVDLMSDEELPDKTGLERTVQCSCVLLNNGKIDGSRQNLEPHNTVSSVNQPEDVSTDDHANDKDLHCTNPKVVEEVEELEEGEIADDDSDEVPVQVFSLSESESCSSRSSYSYCSTCEESSSGRSISSYESYRRSRRLKNAERVIVRKAQHRKPRSWRDRRRRRSSTRETRPADLDPSPKNKEILTQTPDKKNQSLLEESCQPKETKKPSSEDSKLEEDNASKLKSPVNRVPPVTETITIEDDDNEMSPSKELPMEVVDLDEEDNEKSNWTARWLDSSHVKKALQTSKILANVRKKLKLKLKFKNKKEPFELNLPKPSEPLQLIGSVEEYQQLVKDGTIQASSAIRVEDSDPKSGASRDMTAECATESYVAPKVSIQKTDEAINELQRNTTNLCQENETSIVEPVSQNKSGLQSPQSSAPAATEAKNDLICEKTNGQFEPSEHHPDSDANIATAALPNEISALDNEDGQDLSVDALPNSEITSCGSSTQTPDTLDRQPLAAESVLSDNTAAQSSKIDSSSAAPPQALSEIVNCYAQDSTSSILREKKDKSETADGMEEDKDSSTKSTLALLKSLRLPFKPEDIEKLVASGSNCILVLAGSSKDSCSPVPTVVTLAKIDETPLEQPPCPLPLFSLLDGKRGSSIGKTESSSCSMGPHGQSLVQPTADGASPTVQVTSTLSSLKNLEYKSESVNSASSSSVATQEKSSISTSANSGALVADVAVPAFSAQPVLNTAQNQTPPTPHFTPTDPMQCSSIQQHHAAQAKAYAQTHAAVSFNNSQQMYDAYQSWLASQGYQGQINSNYGYGVDNASQHSSNVYKQWEEYYRKMMEACQEGAARASAQSMFCPPSVLTEEQAKKSYSWVFEHPQQGATPLQPAADNTLLVSTPEIAKGSSLPAAPAQQRARGGFPRRGRGRSRGRVRCRIGLSSSLRESFIASAHLSCVSKPDNR